MFHVRGSMSISILRLYAYVRRYKKVPHPIATRTQHPRLFCSCAYIQKSAPSLSLRVPNILGLLLLEGALDSEESLQEGESTEAEADEDDDTVPHPASAWRVIAHLNRRGE